MHFCIVVSSLCSKSKGFLKEVMNCSTVDRKDIMRGKDEKVWAKYPYCFRGSFSSCQ